MIDQLRKQKLFELLEEEELILKGLKHDLERAETDKEEADTDEKIIQSNKAFDKVQFNTNAQQGKIKFTLQLLALIEISHNLQGMFELANRPEKEGE